MFEERVGRFTTVTRYRGLFSREIFGIDLSLIEVRLMNHGQNFFATGTVKRQIQYFELDGGFRKMEDKIQFTVSMGESFNGSLSALQTGLSQDYFIFQPAPGNSRFAILEQGFLLNVKPLKHLEDAPQYNKLKVDFITGQGKESVLIQIPIKRTTQCGEPQGFSGKVIFTDLSALPVAVAEIEGNIFEKAAGKMAEKVFFKEEVSLLVNVPTPGRDQKLTIYGDILEVDWHSDPGEQSSIVMTFRLDYRWYLTILRELLCLEPELGSSLPVEQIETLVLKDRAIFHFWKSFQVEVSNLKELIEIKLEELHFQNSWTQKGVLLHADLTFGITFINLDGVEQYQVYQNFIDEIFSDFSPKSQHLKPIIEAVLDTKILESTFHNRQMTIILDFEFKPEIYQKQITAIVKDDSSSDVIDAKLFFGEKIHSFSTNENLQLKFLPQRIVKVTGKVLEATGISHEGWVSIKGVLEMNVAYIDHQRRNREDRFQRMIQNFCIWEQVKPEMELEFVCELEYDYFQLLDKNIDYQCLIKTAMKAFHQKKIGIKTAADSQQPLSSTPVELKQKEDFLTFFNNLAMDWNLPPMRGGIQEIAKSQVQISQFNYQYSQNAILIKGILSGELEYWDQKQYLQKIPLELPFWRFIPNDENLQFTNRKLFPKIRNCSYYPLRAIPWRKRYLKIHLELGLCTI